MRVQFQHLQDLVADRRGAILPMVAAGVTMLTAVAAIGVDVSRAYSVQNELQTAVDTAALAAAHDLGDPTLALGKARRLIEAHFPPDLHGQVLADVDFEVGSWDAEHKSFAAGTSATNALRITARRSEANGNPQPTTFAKLIGYASLDLEASATVAVSSNFPLCLLALNPTAKNALEAAGSSQVDASDCAVYSNSDSVDSIHARAGASITASAVCAHGGVKGAAQISPTPQTGCARLADPLAAVPTPERWPTTHCDDTTGVFSGNMVILNPGIYCAGIDVTSGSTVRLREGVYQLIDAPFIARSNTRIEGSGVVIHLRGSNGVMDLAGTPSLDLSAPTSGDFAGVVFYADRSQSGVVHNITGNADMKIDGTVYAPTGRVEYTGSSTAAITMLVADTIRFNGNSSFQRYAHLTDVPIPGGFTGIGAATRVVLVR
jgi:hypothetical protein